LKEDERYNDFIKRMRQAGWLDWQIETAIFNFIASKKANLEMRGKHFPSDELRIREMTEFIDRIKDLDEKDTYLECTLDEFMTPLFDFFLLQVVERVANTWGLYNKVHFPNLKGIREFLNVRFNFSVDDLPELSIL
jgi:hypothetical protein